MSDTPSWTYHPQSTTNSSMVKCSGSIPSPTTHTYLNPPFNPYQPTPTRPGTWKFQPFGIGMDPILLPEVQQKPATYYPPDRKLGHGYSHRRKRDQGCGGFNTPPLPQHSTTFPGYLFVYMETITQYKPRPPPPPPFVGPVHPTLPTTSVGYWKRTPGRHTWHARRHVSHYSIIMVSATLQPGDNIFVLLPLLITHTYIPMEADNPHACTSWSTPSTRPKDFLPPYKSLPTTDPSYISNFTWKYELGVLDSDRAQNFQTYGF